MYDKYIQIRSSFDQFVEGSACINVHYPSQVFNFQIINAF